MFAIFRKLMRRWLAPRAIEQAAAMPEFKIAMEPPELVRVEGDLEGRSSAARKRSSGSRTVPYDEGLLEKARTQWQFGDWNGLARIDRETLQHHPDRAKLALFAAAGLLESNRTEHARQFLQLAQDWGCGKRLVSQILIASLHNTLGRAAAASGQDKRAIQHFESSVAVVMPRSDKRLLAQGRVIRESASMGLLPQAARLMGEELSAMRKLPSVESARLKTFEVELTLLQGELSLALQRQQLYRGTKEDKASALEIGSPEWLDALKKRSVSQLGQDIWVLERSGFKRNGFFVEFGATDGVLLSNTWLLEKEFGWQGICAEPNPKFLEKLRQNRQCKISDSYIAGETGKQVEFVLADAFGGSLEYAHDDMHGDRREAYRATGQVTTLFTISLDDFLRQQGAPKDIDFLSVDTEGSEYEILSNFPFDQWNVRLLTVEHNFTARRADIRALLEAHGYQCTESQWDDWYERTE